MKQTLAVKLAPSPEQAATLLATMERFNAACDAIAVAAFRERCANKIALQKIVYHDTRRDFGLSSQMTVRAISKVVEAHKRDKAKQPRFRPTGALPYDERIMSWRGLEAVGLLTLGGRQIIPVRLGPYQEARIERRQGQADLIERDGEFFLNVTLDVPEPTPGDPKDFLGVDLGMTNIAVDSDGTIHSSAVVNGVRHRHRRLRQKLQAKGTKSAKRLLRKRKRREQRFARDTNHRISKHIVATAKDTGRGIALEDLTGIRGRIRLRRSRRAPVHSWSFGQLRSFIAYKAALAGVPVIAVDPRNTSRTCPACGIIDQANRPNQATFSCVDCGFAGLADHIAAIVIGRRAAVIQPNVSDGAARVLAPGTSFGLSAGVHDEQRPMTRQGRCSHT
ncbi:MAG: transposase [Chloroflexota bacterium]|nr:transposase [Chloroflexota bacterium]